MTEYKFDLVVIGAGPAGLAAAYEAKQLGKNVAILEEYMWGGTCPNYGCDPKKILLSAVEGIKREQAMQTRGLKGPLAIDWPALMAYKQEYVDAVNPRKISGLEAAQIKHFYGHATFIDEQSVSIAGDTITADKWIIAVGQSPKKLDFPGAELTEDNEDFLNLPTMPEDVTFIGGGYIGVEFANISNVAGAHVRVITRSETILHEFDQVLVQQMIENMTNEGVEWHFNQQVRQIERANGRLLVTLNDGTQFSTDKVYATAGRVGNTQKLKLKNAGVKYRDTGILVNEYLQTSNPNIYAVGDVAESPVPKLVPVGNYEGRYVVRLLAGSESQPIQYPTIPVVVFGTPRIAQTGIGIEEAKRRGYRITDIDMSKVITFFRYHDQVRVRTAIDDDGLIVGASIIASEAEELLNYFVTAINEKRTLHETQANIYAYPSLGSEFAIFY
ncbi:MAG: NAD(P)/FAD-dependent oxidoreductase [Lactobacillaceae bacterium]|jgi:glutathione reductase (NADPH)|nr:NAD(P)/FAD-dependent oxidoreductase [Lactobacillaceae bacterium]